METKVILSEDRIDVHIEGLYTWGNGYVSYEHKALFKEISDTFIQRNDLVLSRENDDIFCDQVGDSVNGIYFHAMVTAFKGTYAKEDLVQDFVNTVNTYNEFSTNCI